MKRFRIATILAVLVSTAAVASAQDQFGYRQYFGGGPYYYQAAPGAYYYPTVPGTMNDDRFVYRENFTARRQGLGYRAPTYEEYYLRRHNELPPYGYYGQEIRHLRR